MTASRLSQTEFIVLMAMQVATVAFSIDSMLPAMPDIGAELSPGAINKAQLILSAFILGMGLGTFVSGPLSDRYGRKPIIIAGSALYIVGAATAYFAPSLELILAARLVQGLGASGPRIVSLAIIRDLYSGREMARLVSLIMLIFTLVPAVAPLIGSGIIAITGWRGIFVAFVVFSAIATLWLFLRLEEPLAPDARRPFRPSAMAGAIREMFANPMVRLSVAVQALCMTALFGSLTSIQQVFDISFDRGNSFPLYFAGMAVFAGSASILNAALVVRLGMRRMITWALGAEILLSAIMLLVLQTGVPEFVAFPAYLIWQTTVFFMIGLTLGNLNALAMEPLGHIAGMAASVMGSIGTIVAIALAVPIGLSFNGTPVPLVFGVLMTMIVAFALIWQMRKLERAQG